MQDSFMQDKIVFFDGMCVLCNRSVDFLLRKDHKKRLKFAALQSGIAKNILQSSEVQVSEDSVIFYDHGQVYQKSTAVLRIAGNLGFPYSSVVALFIFPRPLRDLVYDYISRNRIRWFGKRDNCRVPDPETEGRILI
jgi:predicted DCC family thiol-disulfide oxidoreductase YuxK